MSDTITASVEYQMYDARGNFHGVRNIDRFDAETTRQILDTLPTSSIETFIADDTANEEGDGFFYSAEAMALAENEEGDSFTVYLHATEDDYLAYLADREARGVPEQGEPVDTAAYHLRAKIAKINALIETLNDNETPIIWLAGDGSWGALPGLGLYLPEQIDQDMRDQYGMD